MPFEAFAPLEWGLPVAFLVGFGTAELVARLEARTARQPTDAEPRDQ